MSTSLLRRYPLSFLFATAECAAGRAPSNCRTSSGRGDRSSRSYDVSIRRLNGRPSCLLPFFYRHERSADASIGPPNAGPSAPGRSVATPVVAMTPWLGGHRADVASDSGRRYSEPAAGDGDGAAAIDAAGIDELLKRWVGLTREKITSSFPD
jgi:hypothetical protein